MALELAEAEKGKTETVEMNVIEAINRAMDDEMLHDDTVLILGEDVGKDGGIFRVTDGLMDKYGKERVIDTPLAESGIAGTAIGLAVNGMRPIAEFQFSGFSYQAFHQFESHAARMRKRTQGGITLPLVMRMPYGAGVRALEHHSESRETYWIHTPGLKCVIPSSPRKAYWLLRASVRDPDPVMWMEPKYLYRRGKEEFEVGPDIGIDPLPGALIEQEGDDVTVVSYGASFQVAAKACETLEEEKGISVELIDIPVLSPYDSETVNKSVRKTGRCVVFHEAHRTLGMGAEIAARITEEEETLFRLEAPVVRVTAPDIIVPLLTREMAYLPDQGRLVEAVEKVMDYGS
ncbi:MAG: alpha-ketoacid dehydrogenase subunit beta [Euryarchaeota archaeon]|nr:alpha-ketoacid dehydrogenase subunit beta [Euryarchaeota archaeon]